jgi:hypothetical protein
MDVEILDKPLEFDLSGLSGDVANFDYGGTGKRLMDEMWRRVQEKGLKHKGINFWVYDSSTYMFTGVEIDGEVGEILEHKPVSLKKYAYYRYVGPYSKLGEVHRGMEVNLATRGLKEIGPRVEKYGHWVEDESKLVTEVFIAIE